jgi:hypothetical protein
MEDGGGEYEGEKDGGMMVDVALEDARLVR